MREDLLLNFDSCEPTLSGLSLMQLHHGKISISQMSDYEIVESLINHDDYITQQFFFKKCRPLFLNIINVVFNYKVDYEEFVNELYLEIMKDNAIKLKQFAFRSSLLQWLKVVATRFFIKKRDLLLSNVPSDDSDNESISQLDATSSIDARIDLNRLLLKMNNRRYAYVLQKLIIEAEKPKILAKRMDISINNLYNIKKRAITMLYREALSENNDYEKN